MSENQQSEFSVVKQRLSTQQKILKTALDDGRLPEDAEVQEFATISRDMNRLSKSEWRAAMDAYMNQLEKFQATVAGGNPQSAGDAFKELLNCKISCHQEFR